MIPSPRGGIRPGLAAIAVVAVATLAAAVAGCGGDATATGADGSLPQGGEPVTLDPAEFTTEIDNPWLPMSPGSRWVYRETDTTGAEQRVVVTVTDRTRTIANGATDRSRPAPGRSRPASTAPRRGSRCPPTPSRG